MKKRIWRTACGIMALVGFMIALGAAGSSDLGLEPLPRMIAQAGIGMAMFGGGLWLGGYI